MKKRHYTCENCGAELVIDAKADSGKCDYCGAAYIVDKQKPAEIHHYFGNVRITPLRIALAISVAALLAAAIVLISLYCAGVFSDKKNPVSEEFRHEKAYRYAGTYLVGQDLEAGEYVAFKNPAKNGGRIYMLTDKNASPNTSACKFNESFQNNLYFTAIDGLYVKAIDCNIFRVGDITVDPMADGSFEGRYMLRGGTDIPVGNYILCNDDINRQYANVSCIIGGKKVEKQLKFRTHWNIGEGDYVNLSVGKLYAESAAPTPLKDDDGNYLPAQYKVGVDIPAGKYKFKKYFSSAQDLYYILNKSGSADLGDGRKIMLSETDWTVVLEKGDYIYLYMCVLSPEDDAQ